MIIPSNDYQLVNMIKIAVSVNYYLIILIGIKNTHWYYTNPLKIILYS